MSPLLSFRDVSFGYGVPDLIHSASFDLEAGSCTALIGPNGGGKSTVLGAAACAYREMRPGLFFPKSSIGDTSMSNGFR